MAQKPPCPKSDVPMMAGLSGAGLVFALYWTIWPQQWPVLAQAILAVVAYAVPCLVFELLGQPRTQTAPMPGWAERVLIKQIGISAAIGMCLLGYWLFPIYRSAYYAPYFQTLMLVAPYAAAISLPLLWWTDRQMADPHDGCYHLGQVMIGRLKNIEWAPIREFLTGWLVKGFFWPLMFVFLLGHFGDYRQTPQPGVAWIVWFGWILTTIYMLDVLAAAAGYMLTLRTTNSHIRSTDPTLFGWVVALMCYPPFWDVFSNHYLKFNDGFGWEQMLAPFPLWLQMAWGGLCLVLIAIYGWATLCFGIRFSNLTYRGLITTGPYRWTKHPAYVCKNLFWWLTLVPFVSPSGQWHIILPACIALGVVNLIYFARAKTEEAHLRRYPDYRAYADWVDAHGWVDRGIAALLRTLARPFKRLRGAAA